MDDVDEVAGAARRPTAADLTGLEVDDWSALLAVALPVVRDLPERLQDATARRLVALPPGRLVTGRSRRDLENLLVRDEVWPLVEAAMPDDAPRSWAQHDPTDDDHGGRDGRDARPGSAEVKRLEAQVAHLRDREGRLADKVAALREDVDRLRRERDGAVARADVAATAEQAARDELEAARRAVDAAREEADEADQRVVREVARARRRDDAEVEGLREELRAVRRERDELRTRRDRLRRELEAARTTSDPQSGDDTPRPTDDSSGRRGRPSRLPDDVVPGTRAAAEWLVAGGRVLLVDGYNVTRTHRPDLALADQRRWLEEAVAALARRRQVDATIIWDSAHGGATTRRDRGGLTVRFTDEGVSADDELVLHVELVVDPQRPVVAVTDDAELRSRLAQHGVDLLDSTSFTWLL